VLCVLALPQVESVHSQTQRPSLISAITAGARFVVNHDVLRGIGLCAICWNFAFFALLAVWAPFALGVLHLDPAHMGLAQSGYGAGLVLGALVAPYAARHLPPRAILIFGPVVSVVAALFFLIAPQASPFASAAIGHFLVGFGPMLWLICQMTLRQLVTPLPLMGRVNATLQTALYGIRPLGALAGGFVAAHAGVQAALVMVMLAFALSTLAILLSPLRRMQVLPASVGA